MFMGKITEKRGLWGIDNSNYYCSPRELVEAVFENYVDGYSNLTIDDDSAYIEVASADNAAESFCIGNTPEELEELFSDIEEWFEELCEEYGAAITWG